MNSVFRFIPRQADGSILPVHVDIAVELERYLHDPRFPSKREAALNLVVNPTRLGMSLGARALVELACVADGPDDRAREWLFSTAEDAAQEAADDTAVTDANDLLPYFRSRELLLDTPLQHAYFLEGRHPDTETIHTAADSRRQIIIEMGQLLDGVPSGVREDLVGAGAECSVKYLIEREDSNGDWLVLSSHLRQDMIGDIGDMGDRIPPWDVAVHGRYSWPGDGTDIRVQVKHGFHNKRPVRHLGASVEQPSCPSFNQVDSGATDPVTTMVLANVVAELDCGSTYKATFPRIAGLLAGDTKNGNPETILDKFSSDVRRRLFLV